jgi:methanogenic corrinoid protein MtbC1
MERSKNLDGARRPGPQSEMTTSPLRVNLTAAARPHVWLRQTIESTVLPRLVTDARSELLLAPDGQGPDPMRPNPDDVGMLAELLLREDIDACERFVERFEQAGYAPERIMLELLAPAARHLGSQWEADTCQFTEVTIGLGRLQSMVFGIGRDRADADMDTAAPLGSASAGRRALLLAMPGSHHTLGVLMLSEFFRRGGWDVSDEACDDVSELCAVVKDHWFDLVGLSASTDAHVKLLPSVILALRRQSRNPGLVVMVGGPSFAQDPSMAQGVGADFTASDAPSAVERAAEWMDLRGDRR